MHEVMSVCTTHWHTPMKHTVHEVLFIKLIIIIEDGHDEHDDADDVKQLMMSRMM